MDIVHPRIQKYLEGLNTNRDEILGEMEGLARKKDFPIIGPLVGQVLSVLAISTKAKRILELGSGFGYSAYWFAKAIGKKGLVICTDKSSRNRDTAMDFFKRGKIAERIDYRVGDALSIIDELEGEFDIILNDIDKVNYPKAFRKAVPRLKEGGLLISDNVVWSGRVVEEKPDDSTEAILTFNRLLYESPELLTTIIPLRDGVSVSVKV